MELNMNNQAENLVIWEKWRDPFGADEEAVQNLLDEEGDEENNEFVEEHGPLSMEQPQNIRVMATPMGIIPVTEYTASGKIFNFWTGHTNFNITEKIATMIERIDGVESLDIFTRYRFRISVGKAFNDSTVMRSITNKVYRYLSKSIQDD
jgi:hypothetical protein